MIKKMMLLAVSAAALLAFAIPAVAQADVELTDSKGSVKVGAEITATSDNLETATGGGTLNCEAVTLHFDVVTNGPEHVVLKPTGEATTSECEVTQNGFPVTVSPAEVTENLTLDTWGEGEAAATFTSRVYSPLDPTHTNPLVTCTYTGSLGVSAIGGDLISVGGTLNGGACGNGNMAGEFTLETNTDPVDPITIDYEATG